METLKRLPTIARSLCRLLFMSREEIDNFLDSHEFFTNDFVSEEHMKHVLGEDYIEIYQKSQRDRYHVLNYLCALGGVEKMYSPPLMDENKSPMQNQLLFEQRMIEDMKPALTPQGRIMDLGCGRGLISAHVSRRTGHSVLGVNIDPTQIDIARKGKGNGANEFVVGDFNMSETFEHLEDGSFDVAYSVQSLSCVHDKTRFFQRVNRCLRIGGRYLILCYVRHPHYDRSIPKHYDLMIRTKALNAAIYSPLLNEYLEWLEDSGFAVIHQEDLSVKGELSSVVLYGKLNSYFTTLERWVSGLSKLHLLPRGMAEMLNRLNADGEAWYELDRMRLISPTWYMVADKVRNIAR